MSEALLAAIIAGQAAPPPGPTRYTFDVTLDRTFSASTPAWGPVRSGGQFQPEEFVYAGENWELWQVIPFIGAGIGNGNQRGARVHLRNRDVSRGNMTLESCPDRIILTRSEWTGSPWTFTRGTLAVDFFNAGSGNAARRQVNYYPSGRVPGVSAAADGVSQGDAFEVALEWDP